ncbi:MAG: type II toxin-antitoxin system MqsA family antitoxin [Candidatus Omnitrophica bacterium]|nr:type II toxin-antitoxin system MqsA family antitoxin [Candidatus Omnitrophota bacterium]
MKCVICKQGQTRQGTTTATFEKGEATIIIRLVPARICKNCGEAYVDSVTTKNLLETADYASKVGAQVEIRNFKAA